MKEMRKGIIFCPATGLMVNKEYHCPNTNCDSCLNNTGTIMKVNERTSERGISKENKFLLDTDNLLSNLDEVIEKYNANIKPPKLKKLLAISDYLRSNKKSIDGFIVNQGYDNNVKKLIAHILSIFYEVGIMFREKLYRQYRVKGKTVAKMPETGVYYDDVMRRLRIENKSKYGRKITKEGIFKDYKLFRDYLQSEKHKQFERDRAFYDVKRFRYLLHLIIKIHKILGVKISEVRKRRLLDLKPAPRRTTFSIDKYLDKALFRRRPIYGVGIFRPPVPKIKGTGIVGVPPNK